ncbi:MAG: choice-of-anchor Q domain-containing protein, partial [Thermoanaerobaculia bacterium]
VQVDGGGKITLSGGNSTRIFYVADQAEAELYNLVLTNGSAATGGAILVAGQFGNPRTKLFLSNVTIRDSVATNWGGGIGAQNANLLIFDSRLVGNRADGAGGGGGGGLSLNYGSLFFTQSELSSNRALGGDGGGAELWNVLASFGSSRIEGNLAENPGPNPSHGGGIALRGGDLGNTFVYSSWIRANESDVGGGIGVYFEGTLRLETTTLAENVASSYGGGLGLSFDTAAYVTAVTFEHNRANYGGGVSNYGTIELENVTFSENFLAPAASGGGFHNTGAATLFDVTFAGNRAGTGGAIADGSVSPGFGFLDMRNVLFADNVATTADPTCSLLRPITVSRSLWPDTSCGSSSVGANQPNTVVELRPLEFSCSGLASETTRTRAFAAAGNAAMDTGVCDAPLTAVDQRGVARPQGAACDIGAYEWAAESCHSPFRDGFESGNAYAWSAQIP